MRGSLADAAANAASKGSPRGVTPNSSAAVLSHTSSFAGANGAEAAMAQLERLQLPPGVSGAGLGASTARRLPNQGLQRTDTTGRLLSPSALKRRGLQVGGAAGRGVGWVGLPICWSSVCWSLQWLRCWGWQESGGPTAHKPAPLGPPCTC
jgi:hypothetical protein